MPTLTPLLHALADLTATEDRPEARATAAALRAGADQVFPPWPDSALAPGIRALVAHADANPIARFVQEAEHWLPWQDSPAAALQPTSLRAIKSVVTLLGPEAPIVATDLRFGLFYQAPDGYYPLHAHEAAETYTLLAGTAFWQAGGRRLTLAAGDTIHHPPQFPHAMQAGPDGFLAIWRWSGDIGFDSYRMLPDPEDKNS